MAYPGHPRARMKVPLRVSARSAEVVRMSSYQTTATPAPTGQEVRATTWMYAAILATLATLSMATFAVSQRLAAAALLLVAGAVGLIFLPLVRRTRRYAEALLDAQIQLEGHQERGSVRIGTLAAGLPTVDVAGNLNVLRDTAAQHSAASSAGDMLRVTNGGAPTPIEHDQPETAFEGQRDGEPVPIPAGHPVDSTWSDTVARITELQRPTRASRRASAVRTGH